VESLQIPLSELPSLPRAYLKALFSRKSPAVRPAPVITATLGGLRFDGIRLERYRALFGLAAHDQLPLLYPQVATAAAFAELILVPEFPFRPLGLVHRRTIITASRPLPETAAYAARFRIQVAHDTDKGTELDFVTELELEGALAWRGVATVLVQQRGTVKRRQATLPPVPSLDAPDIRVETWDVPGDIGRRYASVSGDYNPIHLSALSARLFGYRRAIAHGLWTLGRGLTTVGAPAQAPVSLNAAFKRPLFLPARVSCWVRSEASAVILGVRDESTGAPHLLAHLTPPGLAAALTGGGA
jgi:acyl dehydratase